MYRIIRDGETVLDLGDREAFRLNGVSYPQDWLVRGGGVPGHAVEPYTPEPPEPAAPEPGAIVLTPAQFYLAIDALAGLTDADPLPREWLLQQIRASSALTGPQKREALVLVDTSPSFSRSHPFMDVLGQAILGKSAAELDAAFLQAAGAV